MDEHSDTIIAKIKDNNKIEVVRDIFFECNNCALCCKVSEIPVIEKDITRILDHGYELDQFLKELSPVLIRSHQKKDSFIKAYILKKKPFVKECVFLDENERCKIHKYKPLSCSIYPFAVRKGDEGLLVIVHPKSVCASIDMDVNKKKSNTKKIVELLLSLEFLE
ncbi:MAG: YkgJ family cysteine cluster protein [Candidatus Heimdallarchaeota archaeon]|nr:YkgJ family cysteine cluster protein [Candidatus Heimdallarchaeota archaeon]